jgi:hypothetical protein
MSSANVEDFENEYNVHYGHDSGNIRDEGGVEAGVELVRKKNATAVIWQFFGFEVDEDQLVNGPTCKRCRRKVKANGGNTSSLILHLQNRHAGEFQRFRELKDKSELATGTS